MQRLLVAYKKMSLLMNIFESCKAEATLQLAGSALDLNLASLVERNHSLRLPPAGHGLRGQALLGETQSKGARKVRSNGRLVAEERGHTTPVSKKQKLAAAVPSAGLLRAAMIELFQKKLPNPCKNNKLILGFLSTSRCRYCM